MPVSILQGTVHPKIMCAVEEHLSRETLDRLLDGLQRAVDKGKSNAVKNILALAISGYDQSGNDVDWLRDSGHNTDIDTISIDLA